MATEGIHAGSLSVEGAEHDLVELALLGYLPPELGLPGTGLPRLRIEPASDPDGPRHVHRAGDVVPLLDPEGVRLANLEVSGSRGLDGTTYVLGLLTHFGPAEHGAFSEARLTAAEAYQHLAHRHPRVCAVTAPVTDGQVAAVAGDERPTVLVPLVGHGQRPWRVTAGLTAAALVRTTLATAEHIPGSLVLPLPVPAVEDADAVLSRISAALHGESMSLGSPGRAPTYPPAVQAEIDRAAARPRGGMLLLTGYSGSGKSTLARALADRLTERGLGEVTLLDGDVVRRLLSRGLAFSAADRDLNLRRIAYVAAEIGRHGGLAVAAPIAPYAETRAAMRELVEEAGGEFLLVHVSTPLEVCEARDRKGLYARARRGEIPDFTGISDRYDVPTEPDLALDTSRVTVEDGVGQLVDLLERHALLRPPPTQPA